MSRPDSELAHRFRQLKAPAAARVLPKLADRARHAEKGLIDEYEVYLNPLVWGEGNVHVLGDRGTIRLEVADVKRFESGVVLLTYRPAS
jgi:riboflavin biosynthesis pyrimidine reductase